jgi:hypothetical protein
VALGEPGNGRSEEGLAQLNWPYLASADAVLMLFTSLKKLLLLEYEYRKGAMECRQLPSKES